MSDLFDILMPVMDEVETSNLNERIRNEMPVGCFVQISDGLSDTRTSQSYTVFQQGYLFGQGCKKARLVNVPLDVGINKALSVDDFATSEWVLALAEGNLIRFSPGRIDIDEFPFGSGLKLDRPISIIFTPQHSALSSANRLNKCISKLSKGDLKWYGSILVMKHGIRKAVVNVMRVDLELVKVIVRRSVVLFRC